MIKNPAIERISTIGWIVMTLLLIACVWLMVIFVQDGADNPEQRCDPRDLAGNPVNLQEASANGVGVTTKANCYTQQPDK